MTHNFVDRQLKIDHFGCMKRVDASKLTHLVEVASISAGYPFRGKIDELPAGDVAVVQMRNASPEVGIDWEGLVRVELPRTTDKALLHSGDIILSTRGGRNFAYCIDGGRGPLVCSPHFFVIRLMRDQIIPEFLAWQINQTPAQQYLAAGATGSHILNLKRSVVEHLPITVPTFERQSNVIGIDKAFQAERQVLNQLIQNRTNEMNAVAKKLLGTISAHPEPTAI